MPIGAARASGLRWAALSAVAAASWPDGRRSGSDPREGAGSMVPLVAEYPSLPGRTTNDCRSVRRRCQFFIAAIEAASSAWFSWCVTVSLTELSRQPSGVRMATLS